MNTLTLGTAKIISATDHILVEFMNSGSFLIGSQMFGTDRAGANAALRFCRERNLRVIECR